jgi:5'-methylthioadenosine phosphorylase
MESSPHLAIIGGSGLYGMPGLANVQEMVIDTPFGLPSAPLVIGELEGKKVAFLARHGIGHHLSPTEVNYRANIYALKSLGVPRIVSISACGSLNEAYAPGDLAIPLQIFDFTHGRKRSFFGEGFVAHLSIPDPFCPQLSALALSAVQATGVKTHAGGTFITIEGPRFSTRAESNLYRAWGMDLIGMTTSPEVFLAREAEMCYAVIAHVTDYDVWHVSEEPVTVEMVIEILNRNTHIAQQAIRNLLRSLPDERPCPCPDALRSALITNPAAIPAATRQKLHLLVAKYLD